MATRRRIGSLLFVLGWPALVLILGGDLQWVEGWLFGVWLVSLYVTITVWMYRNDPGLLEERRRRPGAQDAGARADRPRLLLMFLGFVAWFVLMPLDARRYEWTAEWPFWLESVGGVLLILAAVLLFRAFHDNTFLSGVVRVQTDRKQHVVSTGVYGMVRHPMYLGMVLMCAGAPLLLGSRVGLGVAAFIALVLAARIVREERLLADELDGYEDYRRRVRYRLLPLVW